MEIREWVDQIREKQNITQEQLAGIMSSDNESDIEYLHKAARQVTDEIYGNKVYIRGLIEFTNYCKNDCYYCGIRKSNGNASRYRLSYSPKSIYVSENDENGCTDTISIPYSFLILFKIFCCASASPAIM